jgi:hypothetical protein
VPPVRSKRRPKPTAEEAGLKAGYRSGLEDALADQLRAHGITPEYESITLEYVPDKPKRYTPDFILPNGIVVESKGRFVSADRSKHRLVAAQHPYLDLRFVFSNSRAKIGKQSDTSYARWCEYHGFKYADRTIPAAWLNEPPNPRSLAAIARIKEKKK